MDLQNWLFEKPLFGVKNGRLLEERTKFWKELGANELTNHAVI